MTVDVALLSAVCVLTVAAAMMPHGHTLHWNNAGTEASYFPSIHIRPEKNWINDPNGPFRDPATGVIHLWMQYNPDGAVWGNMSWYHVTSKDFVMWQRLGVSLTTDEEYDALGVFSGSVTVLPDGDTPVISYTCVGPGGQLQCVATPENRSDPQLLRWKKSPGNPVITHGPPQEQRGAFRDPTTAWLDTATGSWLTAFGVALADSTAAVALYSTENLTDDQQKWTYIGALYEQVVPGGMFECPDFFGARNDSDIFVLKVSDESVYRDKYYLGGYDKKTRKFAPQRGEPLQQFIDHGNYYASKTFFDAVTGRRILFGWVNEEDLAFADRGWAGMLALPRTVELAADNTTLLFPPLPELTALRQQPPLVQLTQRPIAEHYTEVLPANATAMAQEIIAEFAVPNGFVGEFGVSVFAGGDGEDSMRTDVTLRFGATAPPGVSATALSSSLSVPILMVDRSQSRTSGASQSFAGPACTADPRFKLHVFVDHSVVEAFANDGCAVVTARVYPPLTTPHLGVGTVARTGTAAVQLHSLTIYALKSIWPATKK